jgi:hypothetical protein
MATWSQKVSKGIPDGKECNGCPHAINEMCQLFDEPLGEKKNEFCRDSRAIKYAKKVEAME